MRTGAKLLVEGMDDLHALSNLLSKHRVPIDKNDADGKPRIEAKEGKDTLLPLIEDIVRFAEAPVGFVLDADVSLEARWQATRDRLTSAGVHCPDSLPVGGFIGNSGITERKVGVWLMPDNRSPGALENFLQSLITTQDRLYPLAVKSVEEAILTDQRFASTHQDKARLHTWLAWQEKPGQPYGVAIAAEYFMRESPMALKFIEWFCRLFGVAPERT